MLTIKEFLRSIRSIEIKLIAIESTGGYEKNVLQALQKQKISVSLVNPYRIRSFAKSKGYLAKTDAIDAEVIALFAQQNQPQETPEKSQEVQDLSSLVKRRQQLLETLQQEQKRLSRETLPYLKRQLQKHVDYLNKELHSLEQESQKTLEKNATLKDQAHKLESIPGIGKVSAHALIALLPELTYLSPNKLAALLGVAPFNRDSGSFRGKRSIYGGRALLRRIFYMTTLASIRFNLKIKSIYHHFIAKGKPTKVSIVACMRRFLTIIHFFLKSNAPSWIS